VTRDRDKGTVRFVTLDPRHSIISIIIA